MRTVFIFAKVNRRIQYVQQIAFADMAAQDRDSVTKWKFTGSYLRAREIKALAAHSDEIVSIIALEGCHLRVGVHFELKVTKDQSERVTERLNEVFSRISPNLKLR